jgi:hypothetical protein
MMTLRKAADRGHAHHEWLDSYHTFSFADYYDLKQMSWGTLRSIGNISRLQRVQDNDRDFVPAEITRAWAAITVLSMRIIYSTRSRADYSRLSRSKSV